MISTATLPGPPEQQGIAMPADRIAKTIREACAANAPSWLETRISRSALQEAYFEEVRVAVSAAAAAAAAGGCCDLDNEDSFGGALHQTITWLCRGGDHVTNGVPSCGLGMLSAAWKHLLMPLLHANTSSSSSSHVSGCMSRLLRYIFDTARDSVLSHDWDCAAEMQLSKFFVSYLVAASRAQPAVTFHTLHPYLFQFYGVVAAAIQASGGTGSAVELYSVVLARLDVVLSTIGAASTISMQDKRDALVAFVSRGGLESADEDKQMPSPSSHPSALFVSVVAAVMVQFLREVPAVEVNSFATSDTSSGGPSPQELELGASRDLLLALLLWLPQITGGPSSSSFAVGEDEDEHAAARDHTAHALKSPLAEVILQQHEEEVGKNAHRHPNHKLASPLANLLLTWMTKTSSASQVASLLLVSSRPPQSGSGGAATDEDWGTRWTAATARVMLVSLKSASIVMTSLSSWQNGGDLTSIMCSAILASISSPAAAERLTGVFWMVLKSLFHTPHETTMFLSFQRRVVIGALLRVMGASAAASERLSCLANTDNESPSHQDERALVPRIASLLKNAVWMCQSILLLRYTELNNSTTSAAEFGDSNRINNSVAVVSFALNEVPSVFSRDEDAFASQCVTTFLRCHIPTGDGGGAAAHCSLEELLLHTRMCGGNVKQFENTEAAATTTAFSSSSCYLHISEDLATRIRALLSSSPEVEIASLCATISEHVRFSGAPWSRSVLIQLVRHAAKQRKYESACAAMVLLALLPADVVEGDPQTVSALSSASRILLDTMFSSDIEGSGTDKEVDDQANTEEKDAEEERRLQRLWRSLEVLKFFVQHSQCIPLSDLQLDERIVLLLAHSLASDDEGGEQQRRDSETNTEEVRLLQHIFAVNQYDNRLHSSDGARLWTTLRDVLVRDSTLQATSASTLPKRSREPNDELGEEIGSGNSGVQPTASVIATKFRRCEATLKELLDEVHKFTRGPTTTTTTTSSNSTVGDLLRDVQGLLTRLERVNARYCAEAGSNNSSRNRSAQVQQRRGEEEGNVITIDVDEN